MELFKKRETLVQNIAYMAVMAAINVIFVLLSNILPLLLFLLVFILPLTSTVVTVLCKKRYYPIYFVATLLLCFVVSIGFSIFDTFIYVLPSLITGFLFGLCLEKKVPAIYVIIGGTVFQYCFTLLTFYVLGYIVTNLNLTDSIIAAFGLAEIEFKAVIVQLFLFFVSEIQIILSFLVMKYEMRKFGYTVNLICKRNYILYCVEILTAGLAILSYFYFPDYTIVIALVAFPIYVYQLVTLLFKRQIWIYVSLVVAHFAFIFMFAFLYQYPVNPNQFILIFILFGLLTIIDFLSNYCFKQNTNNIK